MARSYFSPFTYELMVSEKAIGFIKDARHLSECIPYFYRVDECLVIEKTDLIINNERKRVCCTAGS